MRSERTCPDCGATLLDDTPRGPCPQCLTGAARSRPASGAPAETGVSEPAGPGVLDTIALSIGAVPRVLLRDTAPGEPPGPIVRPDGPGADRSTRYRIDGEIARGGMGAVLKGRDPDLGREVAVKVLREDLRDDATMVRRFVEEAQIGGQLQHPGVVPIYELGTMADRRPFFSMKLVKGHTWAQLLAARPGPSAELPRFLSIFEAVCQTMAFAHTRGVIHRDLKPSNVMVGSFGEVQVMDWGLAKVLPRGGVVDDAAAGREREEEVISTARSGEADADYSQAGSVMGTPSYMAPEQARGEIDQLDERADVFALGSILCEILTGKPAFGGRTIGEIHRKAALGDNADALARLDASGADADLIALAKGCLAPAREDRPRDASAVAGRMTAYLAGVQQRMRTAELAEAEARARAVEEAKRRRLAVALASTILLAMALGGGGWVYLDRQWAERLAAAATRVNESLGKARLHQGLADAAAAEARPDLDLVVRELVQAVDEAKEAATLAARESVDPALRRTSAALLADLRARAESARSAAAQAAADRAFQDELDDIRLRQADGGRNFDIPSAHRRYQDAFRKRGLDVLTLDPDEAARRIRESAIRESLIAALDNWARSVSPFRDIDEWLRLATVIYDTDDKSAYSAFCERMLFVFGKTSNVIEATRTCEACLLRPGAIDLARLPGGVLSKALRDGMAPRDRHFASWSWTSLALLAYRGGDAPSALDGVRQSEKQVTSKLNRALNRCIEALARHRLHQADEARKALEEASLLITRLKESGETNRMPDLKVASILLGEAQSLLGDHNTGLRVQARRTHEEAADLTEGFLSGERLLRISVASDPNAMRNELRTALAAGELTRLLEIAGNDGAKTLTPEMSAWVGSALNHAKATTEARKLLRQAQEHHPGDFWLNYELSMALNEAETRAEAIGYLRAALAIRPDSSGVLWQFAQVLFSAGRVEESVPLFQRLVQFQPDEARVFSTYAMALSRLGRRDEAIAQWRKVVEIEPAVTWSYGGLGAALRANGQVDLAIAEFRKALEIDPGDRPTHLQLSYTLREAGRIDEAIAAYRAGVEHVPYDADLHNNFADLLKEIGDLAGAMSSVDAALRLVPGHPVALATRAEILLAQGRFAEAVPALEQSVEGLTKGRYPAASYAGLLPRARWLAEQSERLKALAAPGGGKEPTTLELAALARAAGRPALAARLAEVALAASPARANDLKAGPRHTAARDAALAGTGGGHDDPAPDDDAKADLRRLALGWLRADLASRSQQLGSASPAARDEVQRALNDWRQDPDMAGLRDPDDLAKLPEAEREAWQALWRDVEALLRRTQGQGR